MPRLARLDAPGTLHHVVLRGLAGEQIVADEEDRGRSSRGWARSPGWK